MSPSPVSRAAEVLRLIHVAREYTVDMLNHVPPSDWFRMPREGVTHVAWQVGHLAIAEYRLALERIRGERPEDEKLIPRRFLQLFGKGSSPNPDRSAYSSAEEIRQVFDAVHRQAQQEVAGLDDATLDAAVAAPHPRFKTKEGALIWCAQHEMLHAGQIGLLRRLFGAEPIR